jgi:hypothetical protein
VDRTELAALNRAYSKPPASEGTFNEKHYRAGELGKLWGLSAPAIRDLFRHEPGVIFMGQRGSATKRSYTTMMIPASVAERVHISLRAVS